MDNTSSWKLALWEGALLGSLASLFSTAALAIVGRREAGSYFAGTNAVSHWLWGDEAFLRNEPDWRHTALGYATHHGAAIFWAVLYSWLSGLRPEARTPVNAAAGAVATSALAYVVDFQFTPDRLTPGFEHRLSKRGLAVVYGGFAAGIFLGALMTAQRGKSWR